MQEFIQSVFSSFAEVKQSSTYICGLLFHEGRKTCASMARGLSVSVKRFYDSFKDAVQQICTIRSTLVFILNQIKIEDGCPVLVIDGTEIVKVFAKKIDHLAIDYDGVIRRVAQGLSIMVAGIVNQGNFFPLDFSFWHNQKKPKKSEKKKNKRDKATDPNYKTKIELAIDLICAYKDLIYFVYVALDGAFASAEMIGFLEQEKLKYSMRIARNRKVIINDIEAKLSNHPALKLVRNERSKTAPGFYKGYACFLTVHKRKKRRGGWETVYIISNMKLSSKEHVEAYNRRWVIDKSFRSMKQKFGLKDCQMVSGIQQTLHILRVFLAYSFATIAKIAKQKNSVEEVLNHFRRF